MKLKVGTIKLKRKIEVTRNNYKYKIVRSIFNFLIDMHLQHTQYSKAKRNKVQKLIEKNNKINK